MRHYPKSRFRNPFARSFADDSMREYDRDRDYPDIGPGRAPRYRGVVLPRPAKGSALRGGASVVASGPATASTSIAAAGSQTFEIDIVEDSHLGFLFIQTQGDLNELTVSSISVDNDGLINGTVPAELYRADNPNTPLFGHWVTKNSTVRVTIANGGAGAAVVSVGFTALEGIAR